MLRPLLRSSTSFQAKLRIISRRSFASSRSTRRYSLPPVRVLGPSLWCLTAASAVYLGCAAYEVHQDVRRLKHFLPSGAQISYDDLRIKKVNSWVRGLYSDFDGGGGGRRLPSAWDPASLPALWQNQSSVGKLTIGAISVNAGIYAACRVLPSASHHFAHVAAGPSNYTLFTSMFGHGGPWHLGFNMYALWNFAAPVAATRTFRDSGGHLAAFYLATGILASLAQHLAGVWPAPAGRVVPSLGASGAIMALLGAYGASYPDQRIGIVFVPADLVSFPAQAAVAGIALFEAYGLFVGKWMRLGHAAHLAGLALGYTYVHYQGNLRLWEPARRFTFNQMRRLDVV